MKKLILPLTIAVAIIGCNNEKKPTEVVERMTPEMADSLIAPLVDLQRNNLLIDSAKSLIDSSNFYVAKGIENEMPNKAVNKKVEIFMDHYFRLMKEIDPQDTITVHEYRIKKLNELVELQVSKQ